MQRKWLQKVKNKEEEEWLLKILFVPVSYGPDGCYDLEEYIAVVNIGNKFQEYSNIIGYFMMMVGAFGIIGNSLSIIVLIRKKKMCFNYLLVALNCLILSI